MMSGISPEGELEIVFPCRSVNGLLSECSVRKKKKNWIDLSSYVDIYLLCFLIQFIFLTRDMPNVHSFSENIMEILWKPFQSMTMQHSHCGITVFDQMRAPSSKA